MVKLLNGNNYLSGYGNKLANSDKSFHTGFTYSQGNAKLPFVNVRKFPVLRSLNFMDLVGSIYGVYCMLVKLSKVSY